MTALKNVQHGRSRSAPAGALFAQLAWFIRLRWAAGAATLLAVLADARWLHFGERGFLIGLIGMVILAYNTALHVILQRLPRRRRTLVVFTWGQLLLDFACLTLLCLWTGAMASPIAPFFVFHMIFASLLLTRRMAYTAAGLAIGMFCGGLLLSHEFPTARRDLLLLLARAVTLILTVYLANHMTSDLRRQQRRLARQNKKIRRISRQLRRQQDALVQHEKMVALGQMAAGVAHEITNPLASMDSVLQLVQRKPERLRPDVVETLREQAQRIERVIKQMKAFAHPVDSQVQTLPLNEIVDRAIAMVQYDKRVKQISIERRLSPDVGTVSIEPQALEQVLINLIINALDAVADVERPHVGVRTERSADGVIRIEIVDNGHGILPQHMRRLFEPFFTTKPVGQGTGLGLSISYSLMQRLGGGISARSTPGRETTFTVTLPPKAGQAPLSQSREARHTTRCSA